MQKLVKKSFFLVVLLFSISAHLVANAQGSKTLSGTVTDSEGAPLAGATVVVKDNINSNAATNAKGEYSLSVPNDAKTLIISFFGMEAEQVAISGNRVNATLKPLSAGFDDVVVVGYGTVRKADLTGPVSSVSAKQLEAVPVASALEAMQGRMAGVMISTTEGSPDADIKIRVRGGGSLSQDNSPLYIVDGFPTSSISDIPPSEIETIDILKDASTAAIYGSRGANGVVIVTTKSGKEGRVQVSLNAQYGVRNVVRQVKTLSPYEYSLWQYELDQTGVYGVYDDLDIYKSVEGRDYQDEVFGRTGSQQQYNLGVNGGTKDVKYNIGYARNNEKSIMRGSGFTRDNVNAKINSKINKWLSVDFNARLSYTKVDGLSGGADSNESSAANSLISRSVTTKPIDELKQDTEEDENTSNIQYNPTQRLDATYKQTRRFQQKYDGAVNWTPIKSLKFRSEFGYAWNYNNTDHVWETPATSNSKYGFGGMPQAFLTKRVSQNWRNANTVTYTNNDLFGGDHNLTVLLGHEVLSSYYNNTENTSVAFPVDMTIENILAGMSTGTALPTSTYISSKDNMLSFFGRVNYNIKHKYLFAVTFRADGSSKFSGDNQWGYFPSGSFAWRISEESWMKGSKSWLTDLKFRLSFGSAGNNRIKSGMMETTYSLAGTSDKNIYFGESQSIILKRGSTLSNPKLKWETTITRNFGIDFSFLNNRLMGSIDAYWNTTKDLLMSSNIPPSSGYSTQLVNFGQTSNKGIELSLDAIIVDKKDFTLGANFNISYNIGKIDKLASDRYWQSSSWFGSAVAGLSDFLVEEGGRLGEVYGYKVDGYYVTDDFNWTGTAWELKPGVPDTRGGSGMTYNALVPGALRLKTNENGEVVKERLGNTVAPVTGGFGVNATFKGFDFNAFFTYFLGNKIINATKLSSSFYHGSRKNWNLNEEMRLENRYTWIDPANGGDMKSKSYIDKYGYAYAVERLNSLNANASSYNPAAVTNMPLVDWAVEDGSFLRISNVSLGYTLPKKFVNKLKMNNIRVYVTGYNLYCFTNYTGADPEVDTRRSTPMTPGVDYSAYPKSRTFVGGINITF